MNKREALRVARHIKRLRNVEIVGMRVKPVKGGATYELDCLDTETNLPFVVYSLADLDDRQAAALEIE